MIKIATPQHAVLMLQPKCNMSCPFCVTEDSMDVLSFEKAQALLKNLKNQGFKSAIFGGGEPFFWPHDLKAILNYAKDLGLTTQVGTNATQLPEDFETWNFVDRWVIPLDGISQTVHNEMRPFQNRHLEVIKTTLQKLKDADKSVTVSTVLTQINLDEILEIAEFLRQLQSHNQKFIHAWHLYKFLPQGRGGHCNQHQLAIPDESYEQTVSKMKGLLLPFRVYKRKDMLFSKTVEFYWYEKGVLWAQSRNGGKKPQLPD